MEWNTHNNNSNTNSKSIQKNKVFYQRKLFTSGNKTKHFLKVMPVWSADKGNMEAVPVHTPHGSRKIGNFQFWYSLFPNESLFPAIMYMLCDKKFGLAPIPLKNPPFFPVTRTDLFPLIHRNKKSYGNFNAYYLMKIINKLLDIWNWKTDLQIISSIHNTRTSTFSEYHQIQMDKNNTCHFLKVRYERGHAQISLSNFSSIFCIGSHGWITYEDL